MQNLESPSKKIKKATEKNHHQIESVMTVMKPDFTQNEYVEVLKKFYGFYAPLEKIISNLSEIPGLDYSLRKKSPRLEADLNYFGISDTVKLPHIKPWFNDLNQSQILGILYVFEGSTLGGQIISRHLSNILEVKASEGCQFFSSYGPDLAKMWREFLTLFDSKLSNPSDLELACQSAAETFDHLGAWLKA